MPIVSGHKTGVPVTFIQAKNHGPAANFPINRIVMHGTVTPCVPGGARAVARMFANTSRTRRPSTSSTPGRSSRLSVTTRSPTARRRTRAPSTSSSATCRTGPGIPVAGRQPPGHAAARRALVARLCLKYDVPIRKLNAADLKAGRAGSAATPTCPRRGTRPPTSTPAPPTRGTSSSPSSGKPPTPNRPRPPVHHWRMKCRSSQA
jgi:hypothetical protein